MTITSKKRFSIGNSTESRLFDYFQSHNFIVAQIGHEILLNDKDYTELVQKLKSNNVFNNISVEYLKHTPDFAVWHDKYGFFLMEAKGTSEKHKDGPNFSIETACLKNLKRLAKINVKILLVFENNTNEFYAQWVNRFKSTDFEVRGSYKAKGSKTPMSLITKSKVPRLLDLFPDIEQQYQQFELTLDYLER